MADHPPSTADGSAARPAGPDVAGVLEAAPLPLVLTTTDARVVFANRAMQRLIGVPGAELTGRFLAEYAGPPHGRLRRLAAVASSAAHPVTTEISFTLGRRRSITVRVVVARGSAPAGDPFLVWQVTSSPTAHALPDPPTGPAGSDHPAGAAAGTPAPPSDPASDPASDPPDPVPDGAPAGAVTHDGLPPDDPHGLALAMIRTPADRPVEEVAERLAALAAQAFGPFPVRIALDTAAQPPVEASTDPVATLAVQAEAELGGNGPVAAAAGGTVVVRDLATDGRFPGTGPEIARRLGLASVLAAPLRRGEDVIGSLAVFGESAGAFDDHQVWLADWVAAVAGGVLDAAVRYRSAATESEQLRTAMTSRAVIEQAKGILMARNGVDEDAAFTLLRVESQTRNRRLRDVAADVVRGAVTGGAGAAAGRRPGAGAAGRGGQGPDAPP